MSQAGTLMEVHDLLFSQVSSAPHLASSLPNPKRPVATGVNQFSLVCHITSNLVTRNRRVSGLVQPQLMVWSFVVAFGLVSVIFSVQSTGPANTRDNRSATAETVLNT